MFNRLQIAARYVLYKMRAANGKGHGIHSPFIFDFVKNVLNDKRHYYAFDKIEMLREELLSDKTLIMISDHGAGSAGSNQLQRSVSSIVKTAAKSTPLARLLFRIVAYYQLEKILELGTSLGLSAAYMAAARPDSIIKTIEGSEQVSKKARENLQQLTLNNVEVITGIFDEILPSVLLQMKQVDCVFIDGNHRLQPTLQYFHQVLPFTNKNSLLIFDDIHWSYEMEQAWDEIKTHHAVTCTVDLFFLGIVFFREEFKVPQHFTIRYKHFKII